MKLRVIGVLGQPSTSELCSQVKKLFFYLLHILGGSVS